MDDFHRDKGKADGRSPHCKDCKREYTRRYYEEDRDKWLEYARRYREDNRDKALDRQRRYYEENRDKELERQRRYREENRDRVRERGRRHHEENRDERREYLRRYREENRGILNQEEKIRRAQYTRTSNLLASKKGAPYSPEEDALILADNGMTDYQKAIELGRTYRSVEARKQRLRARANH